MKRRLVKQAGQAITITLPIEWVRENGLDAGNEVEVDIVEKNLVIRTDHKSIGRPVTLDLKGVEPRLVQSYINSAYALGIDGLDIESDISLYKMLDQNIGYAVVSQKRDRYNIKDISGTGYTNLDEIFKQIFQMLISFYEKVITEIFIKDRPDLELIRQLDKDINKYSFFLERAIIKHAYEDNTLGKIMFAYAYSLEQIGDELFRAGRSAIETKIKKKETLKGIYDLSKDILMKSFELHYQFSNERLKQLVDLKDSIRKQAEKLRTDSNSALFISHAVRIAEESNNLIQLILMLQLKTKG